MANMEAYDQQGNPLEEYDLSLGRLEPSIRTVHHEAVEGVTETGHWETIAEYPETGGKDVAWIVDVPGVEAQEAYDEEIDIYVYIPYTQEELDAIEAEKSKPTMEQRMTVLEAQLAAYEAAYLEGVDEA